MIAKAQLVRVGNSASPIVIADGASGDWRAPVAMASALAPFPPSRDSYYPGVRRIITEADAEAFAYVSRTLNAVAPLIGGAYNFDSFELLEASFSLVTVAHDALIAEQRAPHFDTTDPDRLAVVHYLMPAEDSGTAFYRQRATGIELVMASVASAFIAEAQRSAEACVGYITESNGAYEKIGEVASMPDRLIMYQGCLLHSGVIPPTASLSADPRRGRLTANFFLRGRR